MKNYRNENIRSLRIENLLKKNYSKLGVLSKLSDLNMRKHCLDEDYIEDEMQLKEEIDNIFKEILKKGNHRVGYTRGKNKSEFLSLL